MASKKDMRRADLAVPYVEPAANSDTPDMTGTMSSTLPMVAIVTRNRMLGWTAVVFAMQTWLAETPAKKKSSSTPGYFSVIMAMMALMTDIQNLKTFDPFADAQEDQGAEATQVKAAENKIHIRIQQRNGRKTLTTVSGIPSKFDLKKILKVIKKEFACNGTVVNDEKVGDVIQLQGDQRTNIRTFLTDKKSGLGINADSVQVHGF
ncbi:translation initiation factor SUI1 [Verruconis gallopava]|uniref:Translation initiation factor SUI1 n=1 Tax=Verruconis gallopava TaxID=253628 RepID=A0A0D2AYA5_9PEZI|nr:translation initiation factor SUI1 [Verruconis gallopava]KIW04139.1 translation initiation factor SUI1 [Verruconis gallopava]